MSALDKNTLSQFSQGYLDLVKGKFAGLNLTRILDDEDFFHKQVLDSVLPLEKTKLFAEKVMKASLLVDVGFGGGFPILPLASLLPETSFVGFEARRKKADAVNEIANDLELKKVKCFHERIENLVLDKDCVMTLKAVGKIKDYLEKVNASANVTVFFYKGPSVEELEDINNVKGWELLSDESYEVPGTEGRRVLGYVPRRTFSEEGGPIGPANKKNKNLVKLSSLPLP